MAPDDEPPSTLIPPPGEIPLPTQPGRRQKAVGVDGQLRYAPRPKKGKHGGDLGRPPKMTPALVKAICGAFQQGMSVPGACRLVAIAPSTHSEWMQAGERDESPECYRNYYTKVCQALAYGERDLVRKIKKHKNWQAQAFILMKRMPEEWGQTTVRVQGRGPGNERPLAQGPSAVTITISGGSAVPDEDAEGLGSDFPA